jgi:hypothetical protein
MRMKSLLVVPAVMKTRGAGAAAGVVDAIRSHQLSRNYATESHHLSRVMRSGRLV